MSSSLNERLTERLTGKQPRQERQLQTLLSVARAVGTIRNPHELMRTVMRHVSMAFDAERSSLYLHDPKRLELWTAVAEGLEGAEQPLRIPDTHGLCGHVFQTHQPLCIPDTLLHEKYAREFAQKTQYAPRSMLIVPVSHRAGRHDGVLQVMDRRVNLFTPEDLPLMEAIAVQVGITLENTQLYAALKRQFDSFVVAFSAALDARDPFTALHSVNVANYAMGIGERLGLPKPEIEFLRVAGLLHDIGKIGIPEHILTKPGKLTPDEYETMKLHTEYSRQILSKIEFTDALKNVPEIAPAHHEKLDGSGYPRGLAGEQIPLLARILAVADIYDALTQIRPYRDSMGMEEAFAILDGMTPMQLDPRCVSALKVFLGKSVITHD